MPFNRQPDLEPVDALDFRLTAPMVYTGAQETFVVPAGFQTDLASVPLTLTWLIPRYGSGITQAAILHDWLCALARRTEFNRADADGILRRVLGELGVSDVRRYLMWAAVRLGSSFEGATRRERWQAIGIGAAAVPFLLVPTVSVWVGRKLFELLERVPR